MPATASAPASENFWLLLTPTVLSSCEHVGWSIGSSVACLQIAPSCLQSKCLDFAGNALAAELQNPDAAMLLFTWYSLGWQEVVSRADSPGAQCCTLTLPPFPAVLLVL